MVDFSLDVDKLLAEISETDLGKQMLEILKAAGMPKIRSDRNIGSSTLGEFSPADNTVDLSWQLSDKANAVSGNSSPAKTTLAHELYHATSNVIGKTIYNKDSKFPAYTRDEITKFSDSESEVPMSNLIKSAANDYYRREWGERTAFGVGNTIGRQLGDRAVRPISHADATSATESAIKMDLFLRGLKQLKDRK